MHSGIMQHQNQFFFYIGQIYMKNPKLAESKEKSNFTFLFSSFHQFSMNFHDNSKIKIGEEKTGGEKTGVEKKT